MDNYISHTGVAHDDNPPGRGSGRYPFGQGNRPHQHDWDYYSRWEKFKKAGMTDSQIANAMGIYKLDKDGNPIKNSKTGEYIPDTTRLKAEKQIATNHKKMDEFDEIDWYDNHINPATGKTYTTSEIARIIGINESSVRSKRATHEAGNQGKVFETANKLKEVANAKGMIDIGSGVELSLDVSPDRLSTALEVLKKEGYNVYNIHIKQVNGSNGAETTIRTLCPPGVTFDDANKNKLNIKTFADYEGTDDVATLKGWQDPVRVKLDRVSVLFDEEGGTERDGMIQIRAVRDKDGNLVAACPDLSLGNAKYAQVRIATEGDHYIKGMAVYSEDLPAGKDILVNSNKSIKKGVEGALKNMDVGAMNPFGATVIQSEYKDPKTGEKKLSAIQIVGAPTRDNSDAHVEGRWMDWSKNLPSQFLAKQSLGLVKQQLTLKSRQVEDDFDTIQSLTNPVVKKKLLESFADECDSAAVELKASPIAGQSTHVLLPVKSLKDNEIYAPKYPNGTTVALVRFPHAGPFEIPILTVNNNNKEAKSFMNNAKDAVGINHNVADKLSGADFDGDTAIVIPMTKKTSDGFVKVTNIKSAPSLPHMEGFNTNEYSISNPRFANNTKVNAEGETVPTWKKMTSRQKGIEMGKASNLITDMYARGCEDPEELSRAVRYSMVVIDAQKHDLNWKQAKKDYQIDELKKKYQMKDDGKWGGASSLMSRAKSEASVKKRAMNYDIDPETGEKIFKAPNKTTTVERVRVKAEAPVGYKWVDANGVSHRSKTFKDSEGNDIYKTETGKVVKNKDGTYSYDKGNGKEVWTWGKTKDIMQKSTAMYEAKDARELLSTNPNEIERAYADYANHMKTMGNNARKAVLSARKEVSATKKDPVAAKKYAKEVKSLQEKLVVALKNAPKERQAQVIATAMVNAEYDKNPQMGKDERKKVKNQALKYAREKTGASKTRVTFTDKEWEAVQHNAVSPSFLDRLLDNADQDNYTRLAMPKNNELSAAKQARIKSLYNAGWTYEEIQQAVGVSTSTIAKYV